MMKRTKLRIISHVFIILGLLIVAWLVYLEVLAYYSQHQMLKQWEQVIPEKTKSSPTKLLTVEKRGKDKNQLGLLIIPKIGLKSVVLEGSSPEELDLGPGHIKGTAYPGTKGNSAIAGHRTTHGFPFKNLDKLAKGDKIIFANSSGKLVYLVNAIFRVPPSDLGVLKKSPVPKITLLSCDPPYSAKYRLTVTGTASGFRP